MNNECLRTEPENSSSGKRQAFARVITLEGNDVIGEASELTQSKSNVMLGGSHLTAASDFTKHLLAYEDRR